MGLLGFTIAAGLLGVIISLQGILITLRRIASAIERSNG